jgi:hypothetical protein
VRHSHVRTKYPATVKAYCRQQSRWFRNPLVHEQRWLTAPVARRHLRAGLAATFLIGAPALAPLSSLVAVAWTSSVVHTLLAQRRMQAMLRQRLEGEPTAVQGWRARLYLPLGWWIMAKSLWSLAFRPSSAAQW